MSPNEFKRIKHLLDLADAAQEFETINPPLVLYWHEVREDMGLAKLLMLIKDYAYQKGRSDVETSEVTEPNQEQAIVQ